MATTSLPLFIFSSFPCHQNMRRLSIPIFQHAFDPTADRCNSHLNFLSCWLYTHLVGTTSAPQPYRACPPRLFLAHFSLKSSSYPIRERKVGPLSSMLAPTLASLQMVFIKDVTRPVLLTCRCYGAPLISGTCTDTSPGQSESHPTSIISYI